MAAAARLQAARERAYPAAARDEVALSITSGTAMRGLALAYDALAADVYWIRTIQYYGGTKRSLAFESSVLAPPPAIAADPAAGFPLLFPLLDLTTTLDPRFNIAYRFGAVFLAEPYPNGPGRPDLAVALLEKGLRARPEKWEYMQDIGFVHYWYEHDYRAAARWFADANRVPGAPWWLQSLAATTLATGGDRRSSREMWAAIGQSAEVDWLRRDAERRLMQLNALDEIDRWQQVVDVVIERTGKAPDGWLPLVATAVVPGVPLDPAGRPFELSADGHVRLSRSSRLWPLPEEPRAAVVPGR